MSIPATTDYFRQVAATNNRAVVTGLQTKKTAGTNTAELSLATGWVDSSVSAVDVVIYRKDTVTGLPDSSTQTDWVALRTGTTLSGMVLKAGVEPADGYAADSNTVVMCTPTAAWANDLIKGLLIGHNADGSFKSGPVQTALGIGGGASGGWDILNAGVAPTTASGYNLGNKSFNLNFAGDLTSVLSAGMRLKINRSVAAPTQSMSFTAASSQYASKTSPSGITFTSAFTCEAWVYLNSYNAANDMGVISRWISGTGGFFFVIRSSGQLRLLYSAAANNTDFISYQSIPLKRWTHIAVSVSSTATKTATIYINGVAVPTSSSATAATSLTQPSAALEIGNYADASNYFDGQISEARIWSTGQTATQIQDNMAISLVGNETNLVALFQGNGNFNDKTANANNMTAAGGAIATYSDNPYHTTEYAIVCKVAYATSNTTVTVFTGTDYVIPNATLSNPFSSYQKVPFGFNASRAKWRIDVPFNTSQSTKANTAYAQWYGNQISIPSGDWIIGEIIPLYTPSSTTITSATYAISTSTTSATDSDMVIGINNNTATTIRNTVNLNKSYSVSSQTMFYGIASTSNASVAYGILAGQQGDLMYAECAYI